MAKTKDLNVVILNGYLVKDGELTTAGKSKVISNSLAVNHEEGSTSFFDIEIWGVYAEALFPYIKKGKRVSIHGKLKQNRWESDGQKHSKVIVKVQELQFMDLKKEDQ